MRYIVKIARVENVLTAKSYLQLYAYTGRARKHATFIILFIIFCQLNEMKIYMYITYKNFIVYSRYK